MSVAYPVKIFTYVDRCIYQNNIENKRHKYLTKELAGSAALQKLYGQHASFHKRNTFLYDFAIGHWPADHFIWAIQTPHHKLSGSLVACIVVQMTITKHPEVANADNLYIGERK